MYNIAKLQYFWHMMMGSEGEQLLCVVEGAVAGTGFQDRMVSRSPTMNCINNVLEWSGKTFMELKAFLSITRRSSVVKTAYERDSTDGLQVNILRKGMLSQRETLHWKIALPARW